MSNLAGDIGEGHLRYSYANDGETRAWDGRDRGIFKKVMDEAK